MTEDEVVDLLTFMASYDRRTVGETDVRAWHLAVGDLAFGDAMDAVARHYGRDSTEWMMPKHVRDGVKVVRAERIERYVVEAPPPELADNPRAYLKALRENVRRAADGVAPPVEHIPLPGATPAPARQPLPAPQSLRSALADFRKRYRREPPRIAGDGGEPEAS